MSRENNGMTLESQIAKLESALSAEQIASARKLAEEQPDVVRLSFKLLDKPHRPLRDLSKQEQKTVTMLAGQGDGKAATTFAINCLIARGVSKEQATDMAEKHVAAALEAATA